MKKNFKLALLGCASTCLMSAAFAGDQALEISDIDFSNAVCGSEERFVTVKISNHSHDRIQFKGKPFITIDEDDTFEDDRHAVKFIPGSWDKPWKSCFLTNKLNPGAYCLGTVEFNPEALGCADEDHPLVVDGEIERTLNVRYRKDDETKPDDHVEIAQASIDTEVTLLGTASQSYAVLGDYIHVDTDEESSAMSMTQVEGNVAYGDHIYDEDDLYFNGEYGEFGVEKIGEGNSKSAFADAATAYDIFMKAIFDYGSTTDCSKADHTIDLGKSYQTIYPGFYCSETTDIYGKLAFKGDHDDVFVIAVIASGYDTSVDGSTNLLIESTAEFSLTSDDLGTTVDNKKIFWLLPEGSLVQMQHGARFAGNILTKGDFDQIVHVGGSTTAPYLMGGIYGLTDDLHHEEVADGETNHHETKITLSGITVDNDSNDH